MRVIHTVAELRERLGGEEHTAFVPTMGNLHAGHLALVRQATEFGSPVVVSIFVNPLQFGVGEDFQRYPRTLEADRALLEAEGAHILFAPDVDEMYAEPQTVRVVPPLADELCGAYRPGHFEGVATVVLKLFHMVRPRYAVFGKKDYQQLFVLRAMTRQLNLPIEILAGETLRAADGLALSSRNGYLSAAERGEAPRLRQVLERVAQAINRGEQNFAWLEESACHELASHGWRVDYVSVRSQTTLLSPGPGEDALVVLAAAHLGGTRLIDNLEVATQ